MILPIFVIAVTFATILFIMLSSYCCSRFSKINERFKKMIYWNHFIRFFNEEYITITLACLIKLFAIDFSNFYEGFCSLFALSMFLTTLIFPILATKFLWKVHKNNYEEMNQASFMEKWGSLSLDLYVKEKMALLFTLFFMIRRWLVAFIIIGLPKWSYF